MCHTNPFHPPSTIPSVSGINKKLSPGLCFLVGNSQTWSTTGATKRDGPAGGHTTWGTASEAAPCASVGVPWMCATCWCTRCPSSTTPPPFIACPFPLPLPLPLPRPRFPFPLTGTLAPWDSYRSCNRMAILGPQAFSVLKPVLLPLPVLNDEASVVACLSASEHAAGGRTAIRASVCLCGRGS